MELDDAIRCAIDGDALLFVGAGLSFLARCGKDCPGKTVPDTRTLIDLLLEQPEGTGSKHPLERVAGSVVRQKGVDFVYEIISTHFSVTSVDPRLKTLYSVPWKRIYTTNYDNAAEVSRFGSYAVSSVTIDEPQSMVTKGAIIHLNGYAPRVSPANLERGLLLTDASYAASRLVESGWLSFFERDINTSRAIIFAGYSLYDFEIDKALLFADAISRKAFFFVSPDADQIELSTLRRYGSVVPGGVDSLVRAIERVCLNYRVPKFSVGFTCLRELRSPEANTFEGSVVKTLFEQLVYGRLPEKQVLAGAAVFNGRPFIVVREQDKQAQAAIEQGPWRDILFVGEIASGKSASSLTLACFLMTHGYNVYYAEKGDLLPHDLREISEINEKIAIIFENYSPFREAIRDYAACRQPLHRMILTERSAIHEFIGDFIEKTPLLGPIREITLDKIADADAPAFEALTNFAGFWGPRAGANVRARQRFITKTLNGSLYRLLAEIIESQKVQETLRALLLPLSSDKIAQKIFCSSLIVNVLRFSFTISQWQYLFDRQAITGMMNKYADQVRHFLLSDSDHIYARNGILSSHILHVFTNDEMVRECLVGLYEVAERWERQEGWKALRVELVKFSSIERMFSGPTKRSEIFKYYDDIRVFGDTRNNPDYWLQLGIASTVFEDLHRGKLCFENAYSRERARANPNMTKIDNYFSRFQMCEAVSEMDPDKAFALFIKANERLGRQIFLDINRHYPFKTGRHFSDIAAKHYGAWSERQQACVREATIKIRQKAKEWKVNNRDINPDVEILIKETRALLRKI